MIKSRPDKKLLNEAAITGDDMDDRELESKNRAFDEHTKRLLKSISENKFQGGENTLSQAVLRQARLENDEINFNKGFSKPKNIMRVRNKYSSASPTPVTIIEPDTKESHAFRERFGTWSPRYEYKGDKTANFPSGLMKGRADKEYKKIEPVIKANKGAYMHWVKKK